MADITRGRIVQDKDNVGGLRAAYFINYDESSDNGGLGTLAYDTTNTDVLEEIINGGSVSGETITLFKYDLRGTSTLSQNLTASRDNGTIFVEQSLTLSLKKLSAQDHQDLYSLASQRPQIIVEDYNGTLQLVGLDYGADMASATIESGAAMGDLSGYSWVFTAMEKKPANIVEGTAIWADGKTGSTLAGDINVGVTINSVAGTNS